jgi:hypothetical protein
MSYGALTAKIPAFAIIGGLSPRLWRMYPANHARMGFLGLGEACAQPAAMVMQLFHRKREVFAGAFHAWTLSSPRRCGSRRGACCSKSASYASYVVRQRRDCCAPGHRWPQLSSVVFH